MVYGVLWQLEKTQRVIFMKQLLLLILLFSVSFISHAARYGEVEVANLAARTVDGQSGAVHILTGGENDNVQCYLNVTAQSGTTPTLDVTIDGLINGVFYQLAAFAQLGAATGTEVITVTRPPTRIRAVWDLEGTSPDYTFEVNCHT